MENFERSLLPQTIGNMSVSNNKQVENFDFGSGIPEKRSLLPQTIGNARPQTIANEFKKLKTNQQKLIYL